MLGNVSPNLFITYVSQKSCFDCVWFSLGFQNGFRWFWKWVYEMSRVLYLFGLVIAGYGVKMIGFERLVVLSSKVQVLLFVQVHRVAILLHRVAMSSWSVHVRGLHRVSRRDPCLSRRESRSEHSYASRHPAIASRPTLWSRRDPSPSRRENSLWPGSQLFRLDFVPYSNDLKLIQ